MAVSPYRDVVIDKHYLGLLAFLHVVWPSSTLSDKQMWSGEYGLDSLVWC